MSDVLIVDDCAATALTTKWHLEQRGAKVVAAQSLPAGLKILSKAPGDYRVAIVAGDLTLTKCSDAAKKLQDVAPQLKVVCMGEDKSGSYASSTSKPVGEDEADRLVAEYNLEQTEPKRQRVTPYKRELLFGRCILVIDREGMLKNAIPTVLETEYLDCTILDSTEEAFSRMKAQHFDCIVVTCDSETIDLVEWMQADDVSSPVIGLCVDPDLMSQETEYLSLGMTQFMPFPITLMGVLEAVWKILIPDFQETGDLEAILPDPAMGLSTQLENFDGDWEFVMELLGMFLVEGTEKMEKMLNSVYDWNIKEMKSTSHSMKGCSHSSGLAKLGNMCAAIDGLAKGLSAEESSGADSNSKKIELQKQYGQLFCTMAMQEYINVSNFHKSITSLKSVDVPTGLELMENNISDLLKLLTESLRKLWPYIEDADSQNLAELVISQEHLEVTNPALFNAALDCKADNFAQEAVEALEAECMHLLDDLSILCGSQNLPSCCAPMPV